MTILLIITLALQLPGVLGFTVPSHLKQEGHEIVKRFAEHGFDDHDIATVLIEKQPNTFHRINRRDLSSVTEGFGRSNSDSLIRLEFSSGDHLHLSLKKRSVVDSETEYLFHTEDGRVKRAVSNSEDCYATGHVADSPNVIASVNLCNGLHGIVSGGDVEYYIHPVQQDYGDHQVHVLKTGVNRKRRSVSMAGTTEDTEDIMYSDDFQNLNRQKRKAEAFDAWKEETDLTIELALFTDAKSWGFLHEKVPGREDEYLLISMGAANALYGDREKVGYNVFFKVKLIEHWKIDPEGYNFVEDLETNLESFCKLTKNEYAYDMHVLHTGITQQDGPASGMAYVAAVCGSKRCANLRSLAPNRQRLVAHEIGHNLGFLHHNASDCPDDIKSLGGGFMGGGDGNNFSPCNKWELQHLFESGKGACLFEETGKTKIPKKSVEQPRVFPGQSRSPDDLCALYAGKGYKYFKPYEVVGEQICQLFMCQFQDNKKAAFGHIKVMSAPSGFPCGEEMYCTSDKCKPWDDMIGWDLNYLRANRNIPKWSRWSKRWGKCSRKCGTGVQVKVRKCEIKKGMFLSPYCQGPSVKARLCNKKPCSEDPETVEGLRQKRGDERCGAYLENGVPLKVEKGSTLRPMFTPFILRSAMGNLITSKSCILSCTREPAENGVIDGTMISGTPCLQKFRTDWDLERLNIEMRCVNGQCMEFSNCPGNEQKDACGFCGGDELRCVVETATEDVPEGDRVVLANVPAGSKSVDVQVIKKGALLELWSEDGTHIFGPDGEYPKKKYIDDKAVNFAGVKWSFDNSQYLRAPKGTTDSEVVIKLRRKEKPIGKVVISYIRPDVN